MNQSGRVTWKAPPGNWTLMRFGYTPTGAMNKAAPDKGIGLECDKMNISAIDFHFNQMMIRVLPFLKTWKGSHKIGLEIDSYEAGAQTWTKNLPGEFFKKRKYQIHKFLPALTGRVVKSEDHTERFLWDFRRTLSDLIAENYYGRFAELCLKNGFTSYIQPYDKGPFEEMQIGSKADVPLGEYWYGLSSILQGNQTIRRTPKLASSIAHLNGRRLAGVEAFTSEPESSRWQEYPFALKATGDLLFTKGINKMLIHCFVHQPHPSAAPGMTMGPWGIHFDRTNTWFTRSKEWLLYNARCQYLLQQGYQVADLAYFTGEESNVYTKSERDQLKPIPPDGIDYDLINAETILHRIRIENGWIVLPEGTRYRALVLQDYKAISIELLKMLRTLVQNGMVLFGKKPEYHLGARENQNEFYEISNQLWDQIDGKTFTKKTFGRGFVTWSESNDLLQQLSLSKDFMYTSKSGDAPVLYLHRKSGDIDFYFICNQRRTHEEVMCSLRVKGMKPEIWDAVTGRIIQVAVYDLKDDGVDMPVQLEPYGSKFIVFRSPASEDRIRSIIKDEIVLFQTKHYPPTTRKLYADYKNSFNIIFQAKPEMNIMTSISSHMGDLKHPYTDFFAIYPAPGEKLYGKGHATAGIAVGRNGVAVWENSTVPELVLVMETPISGWTNIALIYNDGIPSVFVNGKFDKGKKSSYIVHPSSSQAFIEEGATYFNGDMTDPKYLPEVSLQEISKQSILTEKNLPLSFPMFQFDGHQKKPLLQVFENGAYKLERNNGTERIISVRNVNAAIDLNHNWRVKFPPGSGAPHEITLNELHSLHESEVEGVKYFSGTASYKTNFYNFLIYSGDERLILDLGRVEVMAQVVLNGKDFGILWKRPYRIDISEGIINGKNELEVKVTTLWPNRLIGDEQLPDPDEFTLAGSNGLEQLGGAGLEDRIGKPIKKLPQWYVLRKSKPEDGRVTFTTWKHYKNDDPLLESGLIGPVKLYTAMNILL